MTEPSASEHAFISYVHEDSEHVNKLCTLLNAASIPYWRDRADLGPGDMWKVKIREAISSGSLAFLACFSTTSTGKPKSYQNEEITLAAEEFRLRPPGRTWLIPIRFDDCEIPQWDLGGGRTLRDINYIDLFGNNYAENVVKLIEATKKAMGLAGVDAAIVRTAVNEAAVSERPALLRRLTKDMIRDPSREIELDELITQEISTMLAGMRDTERFRQSFLAAANNERIIEIAETAIDYWRLVEPFCASLQVAARWGSPESLSPWIKGIRALAAESLKIGGAYEALDALRYLPALFTVTVAAMAASGQDRWDNFRALIVNNTVTNPRLQGKRVAIIETVSPYRPFDSGTEIAAHILARSVNTNEDLSTALTGFDKKYGKFHTPVAEWLFAILKSTFEDQFPDDAAYEVAFDYTEIALGVVNEDLGSMRDSETGGPSYFRNAWFGRSTWRYANHHCEPVKDFANEQQLRGENWEPLRAGLFGGSMARAGDATKKYDQTFKELANRHW
ncbi:TIR domain-containing protein [Mycolicibacterium fortuitum]|uniref:TIR domain-containing protein n=1 Tax=Mycolicibacterium fortuitum TaxID=1766 RepID=UPI00148F9C6E|nr:toll/interleukin-1 receptor domain-containing protein [Mycolicibacterium fortuitum]